MIDVRIFCDIYTLFFLGSVCLASFIYFSMKDVVWCALSASVLWGGLVCCSNVYSVVFTLCSFAMLVHKNFERPKTIAFFLGFCVCVGTNYYWGCAETTLLASSCVWIGVALMYTLCNTCKSKDHLIFYMALSISVVMIFEKFYVLSPWLACGGAMLLFVRALFSAVVLNFQTTMLYNMVAAMGVCYVYRDAVVLYDCWRIAFGLIALQPACLFWCAGALPLKPIYKALSNYVCLMGVGGVWAPLLISYNPHHSARILEMIVLATLGVSQGAGLRACVWPKNRVNIQSCTAAFVALFVVVVGAFMLWLKVLPCAWEGAQKLALVGMLLFYIGTVFVGWMVRGQGVRRLVSTPKMPRLSWRWPFVLSLSHTSPKTTFLLVVFSVTLCALLWVVYAPL